MTVKNNFIRIIVVLLVFVSCKDTQPTGKWKEYYIHESVLKKPTVLEYDIDANGLSMRNFIYQRISGDTLISIYINNNVQPEMEVREILSNTGSKVISYIIFENNKDINCLIERGDMFSFIPLQKDEFTKYKITWTSSEDQSINSVLKVRMFNKEILASYKGKEESGLVFELKELIQNRVDGVMEYETTTKETYIKNLGLVASHKTIDERNSISFYLLYTYDKNIFESKYDLKLP